MLMPYTLKVTSVSTIETEDAVHGFAIGLKLYKANKPDANKYKVTIATESADVPMVGMDEYGRIIGIKTSENADEKFSIACTYEGSAVPAFSKLISIGQCYALKAGDVLTTVG